MKKLFVLSVLLVLTASTVFGQYTNYVPRRLPLSSSGDLAAFALAKVSDLDSGVYGATVSGQNTFSTPYFYGADPEVMSELVAQNSGLCSAATESELISWASYSCTVKMGKYPLFHGEQSVYLQKKKGSWAFPATAPNMVMQDQIPFDLIMGLTNASILLDDGSTYSFAADGRLNPEGFLLLGQKHLGLNGLLVADLDDGKQAVFGLPSGELLSVELSAPSTEAGDFRITSFARTEESGTDLSSAKRRPVTASFLVSGITPVYDSIQIAPDDSTVLLYQSGNQLIQASYSAAATVQLVQLPQEITAVYYVDIIAFSGQPDIAWQRAAVSAGQAQFTVSLGQRLLIRFEQAQ